MIKLGITGGIGSGKSVVSELLKLYGIPVYVADIESKRLTETSPAIKDGLIHLFGTDIYTDGKLNKQLLASCIFNDKDKLQLVNSIIHPVVQEDQYRWFESHSDNMIVATEAAILFESGFNSMLDEVIMVYTPLKIRIARVMVRDDISIEKVMERIQNQMADEEKVKLSDFIIDNSGDKSVIEQVETILQKLNYL